MEQICLLVVVGLVLFSLWRVYNVVSGTWGYSLVPSKNSQRQRVSLFIHICRSDHMQMNLVYVTKLPKIKIGSF